MGWPYKIVLELTEEQKHERRTLLDRYGVYAQLSVLIPILCYQLYRLALWVSFARQRSKVRYSEVPSSPVSKRERDSRRGGLVTKWREVKWWLGGEIAKGWGIRGQWVVGITWSCHLLYLCVKETGDDYLHITKRFGVIAASQLPLHYMLSMKSLHSPLALAFKASHEDLNRWHRVSGRVIYGILVCHASWYMNFFVQVGVLQKRLAAPVVIIGVLGFSMLTLLVTTSLETVRRWSYRAFFVCHLVIGVTLMPLLFFHAKPLRIYVVEALALFVFDIVCRKLDTFTGFATVTGIPNTKLVKLTIPVPQSKIHRFAASPGQHVYLQIPAESTPAKTSSPSIHDLCYNPFTVASVSENGVTLVLRTLKGPTTKALDNLSRLNKARPPLNIEGPLGSSRHFPNLARDYDRIVLVAGGVGATFIMPIYTSLKEQLVTEGKSPDRATFAWSMRSTAEASWAIDAEAGDALPEDDNLKIYLTSGFLAEENHGDEELLPVDGSVEMADLARDDEIKGIRVTGGRTRPDLKGIVNEAFRMGREERVAVLVCGPKSMARELRKHVGVWVKRGREVWFHDESFGW
ncbi:hypothetical protein ONS95_014005 [Cadophora gregata]|uniref:uncharacterized protein n=1 Tax=Cadophora gregata TaxID=51156 RepID=UPI0026DC5EC5|nr:uncharacterized protein ONS95_014005 [Cadophora gregata]KAK0113756.1 hypothetical protein ONS96_014611 [Cadophora gregata f. sp. sojae]KAK0114515.1 hypothetical protein ONS95_014005 [Cadophora gregata]